RRGPAVLVWVALSLLNACKEQLESADSLPSAIGTIRRYMEGLEDFTDILSAQPVDLLKVLAAWEEEGNNKHIAMLDGEGAVSDTTITRLGQAMMGKLPGEA
ncbi:unnamed protein product, partial [Choristocarpus tenellus]